MEKKINEEMAVNSTMLDILTIEGYEELKAIFSNLDIPTKKMYEGDFFKIKKLLEERQKEHDLLIILKKKIADGRLVEKIKEIQ